MKKADLTASTKGLQDKRDKLDAKSKELLSDISTAQ